MSSLKGVKKEPEPPAKDYRGVILAVVILVVAGVVATSLLTTGVVAYTILHESEESEDVLVEDAVSTKLQTQTEVKTPTTITLEVATTTSTIVTTTVPSTTTSSTSTTTTTLCGGDHEVPCAESECNRGYIIGSEGLCLPVECVRSVSSGKEGCGAFALSFCR